MNFYSFLIRMLCILGVSLNLSVMSMEKHSHSESTSSSYILSKEILLKFAHIIPNEPPLFRITLKNKRIIYILGSSHSSNPQVLLSVPVFDWIHTNAPNLMLCTEHSSPTAHLFIKLKTADKEKWNIQKYIENEERRIIWSRILKTKLSEQHEFLAEDIQKLTEPEGVMLLYCVAPRPSIKLFVAGFEPTFRKFPWKVQGTFYLETPEEGIDLISRYHEDMESYMYSAFNFYGKMEIQQKSQSLAELESIKSHQNVNLTYGYIFLNMPNQKIKQSTLDRNLIWVKNVAQEVLHIEPKEGSLDLFIICGLNHLKGERSFVLLLLDTLKRQGDFVISFDRMDNSGQWIPVKH